MDKYCCKYKCFSTNFDQVDGMACGKCKHYSYCICRCITYTNSKKNIFIRLFKKIFNQ